MRGAEETEAGHDLCLLFPEIGFGRWRITGTNPSAAYLGSKLGTKLKVMGVELASMGETRSAGPADEVVVYREPALRLPSRPIVVYFQVTSIAKK